MSIPAASFAYVFAANAKAARSKADGEVGIRLTLERQLLAPSRDEAAWRKDREEDCSDDDRGGDRHH